MNAPGAPLVCHILLIESADRLILVDTGFGLADIAHPWRRIGAYHKVLRPVLAEEQTAVRQMEKLGFNPRDVRDIVLTHGDSDHAGGLSDFPWATVHVSTTEEYAITQRPTWFERQRYNKHQWAHRPRIVGHAPKGEEWRGFTGLTPLDDLAPGLFFIPMPGHSRGHSAVGISDGSREVLHAGDSFYQRDTLIGGEGVPLFLKLQEAAFAQDRAALWENQRRLRTLVDDPSVLLINSHDPELLRTALAG
ncbi:MULTISPECIES: MBL fold metallo-hydrolase [unclassified Corynebacterium]|uniref:MBL fold metallo-hydrolase n=1 Tax=unclassified Corynebacterium TaxID=2624378 RepID=UPI0029C9C2BC|nr:MULTISPECIES: MBL fold metallo-hydrolase [unclassified Corynebacterium]WPF66204.1 MBL fold metallo-hydrolase [Corynebacterium sp. 22KM0430]WPF68695.1 MBL fold metallo-hydrolase [Corynebacterium sp. 21KM1197]